MAPDLTPDQQSLTEHLAELRTRLIRSLTAIAIAAGLSFYFSEMIFDIVRRPILPFLTQDGLVFTGVMDKFMAHLKISMLSGFVLSCPFWLYQFWKFVAPGLYSHERKYSAAFIGSGSLLFAAGVSFVYFLVFPIAFEYLLAFGGTVDKAMITIDQYLSFFVTTTVVFGLAFELPLVLVLLGMMGLIDHKFLRDKRRYAVVLIAVLAAFITPPDIVSMSMLMVPMLILYEISVILVSILGRKREALLNE